MEQVTRLKKLFKSLTNQLSDKKRKENNKNYSQKMEGEIEHYKNIFKDKLFQDVPPVWTDTDIHFVENIKKKTGVSSLNEYISRHTKNKKKIKLLGLGSGACGLELLGIAPLLKKNGTELELSCVDINESALKQGENEAKKQNIKFNAITQDVNKISLPENKYDVILAHASLHHFLKLDHICKEINKSLKPGGIFVTVDIPTKNGYLMWDETFKVVNNIWKILPPKFKIDYTKHADPVYAETYENVDYSINSFECINSEAILPSLRKHLNEVYYIPAFSLCRRFFDTKFGPNFDLRQALDRSIFDFIVNLDKYYLENNILKPETFFGIYSKK